MTGELQARRPYGVVGPIGVTVLRPHNPNIVAWWSAAFPGFGHLLLHQYVRGVLLTLSEVIINSLGHVNEAMVYSFSGRFELAKAVVHPNYMYGYAILYIWTICDSRRTAMEMTRISEVAESEPKPQARIYQLSQVTVSYLALRKPWLGACYSAVFPGLGQLYNGRVFLAFYGIVWWWIYVINSKLHVATLELFYGTFASSTTMLDPHWLLFMPSVMGGAVYHAYVASLENNHLFRREQRSYLKANYQAPGFDLRARPPDGGTA